MFERKLTILDFTTIDKKKPFEARQSATTNFRQELFFETAESMMTISDIEDCQCVKGDTEESFNLSKTDK